MPCAVCVSSCVPHCAHRLTEAQARPVRGPEEVAQLLVIQSAIDQIFRDAAARTGVELVLASSLSAGHALGSADPWVQPFHPILLETGGSFHPNEAGMTAIAAASAAP